MAKAMLGSWDIIRREMAMAVQMGLQWHKSDGSCHEYGHWISDNLIGEY